MKLRDGASSAKSDGVALLSRDTIAQRTSTGPIAPGTGLTLKAELLENVEQGAGVEQTVELR